MYLLTGLFFLFYFTLICTDEFKFHSHRSVSKKERWYLASDLLLLAICTGLVAFTEFNAFTKVPFGMVVLLSLISITKNEFLYSQECSAGERWLHSVIYMLHPLMLIVLCVLWPFINGVSFFLGIIIPLSTNHLKAVGIGYFSILSLAFIYQVIRGLLTKPAVVIAPMSASVNGEEGSFSHSEAKK